MSALALLLSADSTALLACLLEQPDRKAAANMIKLMNIKRIYFYKAGAKIEKNTEPAKF
jgi:hypothetical protein